MKKFKSNLYKVVIFSCFIVVFTHCTKDKTPVIPEPCDPTKVYFQNNILPIISSNCAKSGCHNSSSKVEGLDLSNYNGIMQIVKAGKASSSELMEVINETNPKDMMPPPPDAALTSDQKNLITKWINEGALNNYCVQDTGSCNTASVTYSGDVSKIISTNCLGCHSGNNISGGINLSNYGDVQSAASTGKLYNSILKNGAAVAMPPSYKLTNCEIKKVKAWIDAGKINN